VLDEHGIRPPIIAAGINLFGGPLGLLHRHVTGAMPIRRNTKDPAYLITLKAYVAELLRATTCSSTRGRAQLQRRAEVAEDRAAPRRRCRPACRGWCVCPGDRLRPRARGPHPGAPEGEAAPAALQPRAGGDGALRRRLPVARVRHLRPPIALDGCDPHSRRATCSISPTTPATPSGASYKVLPTAVVACAMRPSMPAAELEARADALIDVLCGRRREPRAARRRGGGRARRARAARARGIIVLERGRFRVRERNVLRYYARTIEHLLTPPPARTH
jgi:hypothetical protein